MMRLVEVQGTVEAFDGRYWNDVEYAVPMEVVIIGEQDAWTYATVIGDVPVRWLTQSTSVKVMTTEAVLL